MRDFLRTRESLSLGSSSSYAELEKQVKDQLKHEFECDTPPVLRDRSGTCFYRYMLQCGVFSKEDHARFDDGITPPAAFICQDLDACLKIHTIQSYFRDVGAD